MLFEDPIPSPSTSSTSSSCDSLKHKMLYKTEFCRNWTELGQCRYGRKCRYAHGLAELREVTRPTRYKTQICRAYHVEGTCPYGVRCTFIHDLPSTQYWSSLPVPSTRTESRFFRNANRRSQPLLLASSSISSAASSSSSSSTSSSSSLVDDIRQPTWGWM